MENWEREENRGRRKLFLEAGGLKKSKRDKESYVQIFEISDDPKYSKLLGVYKWSEKPDFEGMRVTFMGLSKEEYLKLKEEEARINRFNFKNK